MQVLLFSIVAICIAAINAQMVDLPPPGILGHHSTPPTTSTSSTTTTVTSKVDDDNSPEHDDDDKKPYDHEHKSHHEHEATISVDVHNILDMFKQELHASEKRILEAIQHKRHLKPATAPKSYRTADRLNEKEND